MGYRTQLSQQNARLNQQETELARMMKQLGETRHTIENMSQNLDKTLSLCREQQREIETSPVSKVAKVQLSGPEPKPVTNECIIWMNGNTNAVFTLMNNEWQELQC